MFSADRQKWLDAGMSAKVLRASGTGAFSVAGGIHRSPGGAITQRSLQAGDYFVIAVPANDVQPSLNAEMHPRLPGVATRIHVVESQGDIPFRLQTVRR